MRDPGQECHVKLDFHTAVFHSSWIHRCQSWIVRQALSDLQLWREWIQWQGEEPAKSYCDKKSQLVHQEEVFHIPCNGQCLFKRLWEGVTLLPGLQGKTSTKDLQRRCAKRIRLGYCFTPYQRLWLYNGAPLVTFYDTLGIRRTYGARNVRLWI